MSPTDQIHGLVSDLRVGLRRLRKSPGFTAVAIASLALGLGANVAVFSLVDSLLLSELPYPEPARLVRLWETFPHPTGVGTGSVSVPNLLDWREQSSSFEAIAGYTQSTFNLAVGPAPERVAGIRTTPELFGLLGVEPERGRPLTADDARPGAPRAVVIGHGLWQARLGGDPAVIGRTLRLDGEPATVVGVMPAGFRFPPRSSAELWSPLIFSGDEQRGQHWLATLARLRPGATLDSAASEMETIARRLAAAYPDAQEDRGTVLAALPETTVRDLRPILLALWGSVGFVLLIGCGNVANLLLARATSRRREMAVRAALGSSRLRLVRQVLAESLLLAAGGALLGVPLGAALLRLLARLPGSSLPAGAPLELDGRVLLYALAATAAAATLCAVIPALRSSRPRLTEAFGARGGADGYNFRRDPLRGSLVAAEVALALVVLIGAGLLGRTLVELTRIDPGLRAEGVLTTRVALSGTAAADGRAAGSLHRRLLERVAALPGVESAGLISRLPLQDWGYNGELAIAGRPPEPPGQRPFAEFRSVSPGYFRTLGIPLLAGRGFGPADGPDSPNVALVNRSFADRWWPDGDPLGARMAWGGSPDSEEDGFTVVGVVGDVRSMGLDREVRGEVYHLDTQAPSLEMSLVARSAGDPLGPLPAIRSALAELDPDGVLYEVRTMDGVIAEFIAPWRFQGLMLSAFGALALLLALGGVYGVMSYAVAQRTRELGVRLALGARPRVIAGMVVRQGLILALAGAAAGVAAALALTRLLAAHLVGVASSDPATYATVTLALVAVAVTACLLPARRAARVDPSVALRAD